jgi:hypothetical protein
MDTSASTRTFLKESISVGVVGATTVALWFLVVDVVTGTPLRTPGILGSAVFLGISAPQEAVINATTVGLFSLLHGAVFFAVGVGTTALVRAADRAPNLLALFVLLTVVLQVLFAGGVAILAQFLLGVIAWWSVLGGNLVASFLMGSLLLYWHPATAQRLKASDSLPQS